VTDIEGSQITLKPSSGEKFLLACDSSTKLLINGQPANFTALRPGAEVRAAYVPGQRLPLAVSIDATSQPGNQCQ
jgi:hypothetical protein